MRTAAACICLAFLAGPAAATGVARAAVSDEVVMLSATGGQDGMRVIGRIREIKKGKIWIVINDGQSEGPVSVPVERVKRIEYDFDGRRAGLPKGDHLARYRLALWALSLGREEEARFDLETVAGKGGVPPEAYFLLARIQEKAGDLRKALESYRAYLLAGPKDMAKLREARAAVKRLDEKVKHLPPEKEPVKEPVKPGDPPHKTPPRKPRIEEGLEIYPGGWKVQPWGNPASVTQMKDEDGNRYLAVQLSGRGREAKTALGIQVGRTKKAVLKSSKLTLNVYNPGKRSLPISVAFNTVVKGKFDYYESRTSHLGPGWKTMVVDLNGKDFKSRATEWAYRSPIKGKGDLKGVIILINARRKGTLCLDYIKFKD